MCRYRSSPEVALYKSRPEWVLPQKRQGMGRRPAICALRRAVGGMMRLRSLACTIAFFLAAILLSPLQALGRENAYSMLSQGQIVETYKQFGIMADISYLGAMSIGLGIFQGRTRTAAGHFSGHNEGAIVSYCIGNSLFTFRPFFGIFGGSAGMLLGISTPLSFNSHTLTIGISPEVGISVFGLASFYYRYNFYLERGYSSHEVGLALLYNMCRTSHAKANSS